MFLPPMLLLNEGLQRHDSESRQEEQLTCQAANLRAQAFHSGAKLSAVQWDRPPVCLCVNTLQKARVLYLAIAIIGTSLARSLCECLDDERLLQSADWLAGAMTAWLSGLLVSWQDHIADWGRRLPHLDRTERAWVTILGNNICTVDIKSRAHPLFKCQVLEE